MSYIINKSNGDQLLVLQDAVVDTSTSLQLVGRNFVGYGELQNENFVFLLENFSNPSPPPTPLEGQTWYDSEKQTLNVYTGQVWQPAVSPTFSETAPQNPRLGSFWYELSTKSLHIWNGDKWRRIGPEAATGFGDTRFESKTIKDTDNNDRPVIVGLVDSDVVSITSKDAFLINPSENIPGFDTIAAGTTVATGKQFRGNLLGIAERAARFEVPVTINGSVFDGSVGIDTEYWGSTRLITVGGTSKSVDGSDNVSWTVPEILPQTTNLAIGSLGVGTLSSGVTGEIRATGEIFSNFSDDRLKNRLEDVDNATVKLQSLDSFYYEPNELALSLGYKSKRSIGLSAQQVQQVLPEAVGTAPVDDKYLTIQYEKLVPLLISSIRELKQQIDELQDIVNNKYI